MGVFGAPQNHPKLQNRGVLGPPKHYLWVISIVKGTFFQFFNIKKLLRKSFLKKLIKIKLVKILFVNFF